MAAKGVGYLADQSIRLRRTKWPDAAMLADELFTIFSKLSEETTGNIQVESSISGGVTDIEAGKTLSIPPFDLLFPEIIPDEVVTPSADTVTTVTKFWQRATIPGKIISGSVDSYVVRIYPNGPNGPDSREVICTPLNIPQGVSILQALRGINPDWSILLIGTWTMVFRVVQLEVTRVETNDEDGDTVSINTKVRAISVEHFLQVPQ